MRFATVSALPPSLKTQLPGCSTEVAKLVDAMLENSPDRRPQTVGEVAKTLSRFASGSDLTVASSCERSLLASSLKEVRGADDLDDSMDGNDFFELFVRIGYRGGREMPISGVTLLSSRARLLPPGTPPCGLTLIASALSN